jgi:hypothetical protein
MIRIPNTLRRFVSRVITNTFPPPDSLEFQDSETADVSCIAQTDDRQALFVYPRNMSSHTSTRRVNSILYSWHIVLVNFGAENFGAEGMSCRCLIQNDVYNKCDTDALVACRTKD